ncbi:hypothetical protein CWI38_0673p0020 [Hamiltosporidium tvaerminnensis]|uniref:Uncharacterized protein n=1 Tax=Hamiltosporidium tvaerminnensis TaxID=1176355 RepID=A0A4Q9LWJ4_9MICR|nr:hypothetical protein CWI38_0673p0020 [Hamiltosporidium tvaerminnensis]
MFVKGVGVSGRYYKGGVSYMFVKGVGSSSMFGSKGVLSIEGSVSYNSSVVKGYRIVRGVKYTYYNYFSSILLLGVEDE